MARRKKQTNSLQNVSPQADSRLFKLPAELRNRIYEYAFQGQTKSIGIYVPGKDTPPGLLTTCKLIYSETRQIYYHTTIFAFNSLTTLSSWLSAIGSINRKQIRFITFHATTSHLRLGFPIRVPEELLRRIDRHFKTKGIVAEDVDVKVKTTWSSLNPKTWTWARDGEGRRVVVRC